MNKMLQYTLQTQQTTTVLKRVTARAARAHHVELSLIEAVLVSTLTKRSRSNRTKLMHSLEGIPAN